MVFGALKSFVPASKKNITRGPGSEVGKQSIPQSRKMPDAMEAFHGTWRRERLSQAIYFNKMSLEMTFRMEAVREKYAADYAQVKIRLGQFEVFSGQRVDLESRRTYPLLGWVLSKSQPAGS